MAKKPIEVAALRHQDKRRNIPTAELEPVMREEEKTPIRLAYERRNRDLDPQLVWRGKDEEDWSDPGSGSAASLIVQSPPLYIQEKIHPKVLIDDLLRQSKARRQQEMPPAPDLFADFNGLPDKEARTDFYLHDANWSNRMILGDSLAVMASLAEREGLRGRVQCIYLDPPYGIRFNSNFQWSTTSRDVKDGSRDHITREPEQVKAFRDTWRDGIHSYLTYLRDRLTVARDLLADSGSIFVQIGDENVHRVRALMDEVFGPGNIVGTIIFRKSGFAAAEYIPQVHDFILWYGKSYDELKFRPLYREKTTLAGDGSQFTLVEERSKLLVRPITASDRTTAATDKEHLLLSHDNLTSEGFSQSSSGDFLFERTPYRPAQGGRTDRHWKTVPAGLSRLAKANRLMAIGKSLRQKRYLIDFPVSPLSDHWEDTVVSGFADPKIFIVQTTPRVVERCVLMATDPGDLVLDPTCGSGTTAFVAEQWGRRWITIDTSRVALALARARIMGARYPYYLLADSPAGQKKEAEASRAPPKEIPTHGDIRHGFVYERVPHITLKSIANNAEIDVIWEKWQASLEPLRTRLNTSLGRGERAVASFETRPAGAPQDEESAVADGKGSGAAFQGPHAEEPAQRASRRTHGADAASSPLSVWEEWEIPREAAAEWPAEATKLHAQWWAARIARQQEIDASIAAKAEFEYLYDKPYPDPSRIRVSGPFTVESLSPHRVLAVDADDSLIDTHELAEKGGEWGEGGTGAGFAQMVLESLETAGVQQAHKDDRIAFTSLVPWPGHFICAEGAYLEGETRRRAGILLGPEFGTVARADLVAAAREAADARFDVVIACAFNFDAHSAELDRLGRIPVLKARMNPDLHMAGALKTTASGNLFVVFGEPDIAIEEVEPAAGNSREGGDRIRVAIKGVDVFRPQTGEVESGGPETIALWFLDTDYNEESFFIRHAYFLGAASDPYKALKTTLRAEIDEEAWASLRSAVSRPFPKPRSGRIAVKVINHLGDEVMKVFAVK